MLKDLRIFVKERFPLRITIPLTVILFGAPAVLTSVNMPSATLGWLSSFIALLCIRIMDDVSDLEFDRRYHPERGLSSGRISPENLSMFLAVGIVSLILFNIWPLSRTAVIVSTILYYAVYNKGLRHWLPVVIRPFFSNIIFAIIPLYAGLLDHDISSTHILISSFIYAAVVAHEWAHDVHGSAEGVIGVSSYSSILGARKSALIALSLFGLADLWGWLFWLELGKPAVFGILLLGTSIHILLLGIRLIQDPRRLNARPFYIYGFIFFLLPLTGLLVERLSTLYLSMLLK